MKQGSPASLRLVWEVCHPRNSNWQYPKEIPPQIRENFQVVKSNKDKHHWGGSFSSRLSGVGCFEVPRLRVPRGPPSGSVCTRWEHGLLAYPGYLQYFAVTLGVAHREMIPSPLPLISPSQLYGQ